VNDGRPAAAAAGPPPELILGPCDEMRAEVFVRLPVPVGCRRPRLEGTLTGPTSRRGITLPAVFRFQDLGPGPAGDPRLAAARVVCTEPACWTPEQPARYRLDLRLCDADEVVAHHAGDIGLRRLGVRGRSVWFDGRRWVPRIVSADPAAAHAAATVCGVTDPDEDTLATADEVGTPLACLLTDAAPSSAAARIARWALHPSVMMVILAAGTSADEATRIATSVGTSRGTVLLGLPQAGADPPPAALPEGIQLAVVRLAAGGLPHPGWRAGCPVPLLAWRETATDATRQGCDRLQAELAAWGLQGGRERLPWDWAGYAAMAPQGNGP